MTWISDDKGNRCSVERWGSEEAARAALATLEGCSDCSDLRNAAPTESKYSAPPIPVIVDIHKKVYAAVSQPDALDMATWHTCDTTHCRGGWVIALAGEAGKALERFHDTGLAAQLIYHAADTRSTRLGFTIRTTPRWKTYGD